MATDSVTDAERSAREGQCEDREQLSREYHSSAQQR